MRECLVVANWDNEARVWVATSDDVPGLVTEAESAEQLVEKLKVLVPELLAMNAHLLGSEQCSQDVVIHYNKDERVRMYA